SWRVAGMNTKHTTEQVCILQCSHDTASQPGAAIEHQETTSHKVWTPSEATVLALVAREIAANNSVSQGGSLAKTETEPFPGNRVNAARGVAHQGHATPMNRSQRMHRRGRPPLRARRACIAEPGAQFGKCRKPLVEPQMGVARNDRHTNLVWTERRDIRLA